MTIHAFTDGASRGNPGESGIGVLLKDERGGALTSIFGYIGTATNNVAEYTALVTCLRMVSKLNCTNLVVHSDSELLVRQMQGTYKVKEPRLKQFVQEARAIIADAGFQCRFNYIARERNRQADELANRAIDTKQPLSL